MSEVVVFGCVVSAAKITVDRAMVEVVLRWECPTTAIEIWGFLGLARCYRRFIHGFSSLAMFGCVVSAAGIAVDQAKDEVVLRWECPTTTIEIHGFLGLARCYRRCMHHLSSMASSLT